MALDINNMPVNDRGEVWYGGQMVGQMPGGGGGGGGTSRADIAQAIMQQQQPQMMAYGGGGGGGFDVARGPDQGSPYRQAIGNQGWSFEGNNVYDPGGNIVGRSGVQQYGAIPGYGGGIGAGDQFNQFARPVGSSLSGGAFGGRGGEGREGFGEGVSDPAQASPSFSEPGYSNVGPFGRSGDDSSPASQAAQAAQAGAFASSAMGRAPGALTEGLGGKGDRGYAPGDYSPNFNSAFNSFAPGAPIGAPVAGPWESGAVPLSDVVVAAPPSGWQTQTFNPTTPPGRTMAQTQEDFQTGRDQAPGSPSPTSPGVPGDPGFSSFAGGYDFGSGFNAPGFSGGGGWGGFDASGFSGQGGFSSGDFGSSGVG